VPVDNVGGEVIFRGGHGWGLIVIENALSAVCAPVPQLSVARTVKFEVPAVDGVPVISPVGLMLSPAGNDPPTILKEIGTCPPEVCSCCEYACPTVTEGKRLGVVMLNARQLTVTFVEIGDGGKAVTQPLFGIPGTASAVTVYKPGFEYVCVTVHGAVQLPIMVNGSAAENRIRTPQGGICAG
jgi:hypothetical protein